MNIPREPVRLIGIVVALILGAVTTLQGSSVISDIVAGHITDIVNATAKLLVLLAPIITAEIGRQFVTPVAEPSLPVGTEVKVTTAAGEPIRTQRV